MTSGTRVPSLLTMRTPGPPRDGVTNFGQPGDGRVLDEAADLDGAGEFLLHQRQQLEQGE